MNTRWGCYRQPRDFVALAAMLGVVTALSAQAFPAFVRVDVSHPGGSINPGIYGQYLEHVQEKDECIYPSIWDDKSPFSDPMGLRADVITAATDLGIPVVRWPGGCFADVYHWENGIGPRRARPTLKNLFWGGNESNQFGTDEFLRWSGKVGNQPYINVNMGSGTLDEALRWLEYCNGSADSPQGKRRAVNGHPESYNVPYWGVGNETWGQFEVGHTNAQAYATQLAEWAAAMRKQDPSIKILAVGSNEGADPAWDREVLTRAGHLIDYLTIHIYGSSTDYSGQQYEAVAFSPIHFEAAIKQMAATMDNVRAKTKLERPIQIALDEWNIRHYKGKDLLRKDPRNMQDAIFVAGALDVLLRHCDRVAMANYVFLVNGHAPLLVNATTVVKTPIYYVFQQYARWMKGRAVPVQTKSLSTPRPNPLTGRPEPMKLSAGYIAPAPYLDSAAALHDDGTLALTLLNRHPSDAAEVSLDLPAGYRIERSWLLHADDLYAVNDFKNPRRITPVETAVGDPPERWRCAPHSLVMLLCSNRK